MDFNKKFKDQVALITGAGSGLGSALAFALGKQGAKPILGMGSLSQITFFNFIPNKNHHHTNAYNWNS